MWQIPAYSGEVCYRLDWDAQLGQRVVCIPPIGPGSNLEGANNGCPADFTRAEAGFGNKVFPWCTCDSYENDAWDKAQALSNPNHGRMCMKVRCQLSCSSRRASPPPRLLTSPPASPPRIIGRARLAGSTVDTIVLVDHAGEARRPITSRGLRSHAWSLLLNPYASITGVDIEHGLLPDARELRCYQGRRRQLLRLPRRHGALRPSGIPWITSKGERSAAPADARSVCSQVAAAARCLRSAWLLLVVHQCVSGSW